MVEIIACKLGAGSASDRAIVVSVLDDMPHRAIFAGVGGAHPVSKGRA